MDIIWRSSSPWASPLYMVSKHDGSWCLCGDYRCLNDITTSDRYPVSHIQDFSTNLHNMNVFSKAYLVCGYHQIPAATDDIPKTAITTSFSSNSSKCCLVFKTAQLSLPTVDGLSMPGIGLYLHVHR